MDATIDALTGATILSVERRGLWLEIETTKGRVIVGASQAFHDLRCMGCGEDRLVEIVMTRDKAEAVCGVCARSWPLKG